ncbi:hypothetical protein QJQ45_003231 [Haematococcus lacustris]|nr:hypothetical protein QJQ45_003231 [Haematococcus lacustris]
MPRPLELCSWKDLEALAHVGKEYQQGYKRVNDRLPKVPNGVRVVEQATTPRSTTTDRADTEFFRKGVAISVWQNSADDAASNWTRYANSKWPFGYFGISTTRGKYKIGKSCDFWTRFREDLQLAKQAGCTAFRFSFEWARIEPVRGMIDNTALDRFTEMLDVMDELGLEPNATLHHFTHPIWFEDLGGFSEEANIPMFVDWAVFMFRTFQHRIKLWATFNEPTCYCFLAFIVGMMPPSYIFNLVGAGRTLGNMLKAHTAAYRALKALPGGQQAQIGIVHHHITFAAQGTGALHALASGIASWMEYWWGWDVVDQWMLTGEFSWDLPVLGRWLYWKDPAGKPPCDWWGINYYSRTVLSWWLQPSCMPAEVMTDMYYPIYPDGLYKAIVRSSRYNIPMYITETGIADSMDNRRTLFIDSYFKEVMRALADGYDVRGFYYWTLVDNFEWATGFTMKFGLYRWEPDGSVDRVLKEGSRALVRFYKTLPDNLSLLRQAAQAAQRQLGPDMGVDAELENEGVSYVPGGDSSRQIRADGRKAGHAGAIAALG